MWHGSLSTVLRWEGGPADKQRQTEIPFSLLVITSVKALGLLCTFSLSTSCQEKCWGIKKDFESRHPNVSARRSGVVSRQHIGAVLDVFLSETAYVWSLVRKILFFKSQGKISLTVVMFWFAVWYLTANYRDEKARALVKIADQQFKTQKSNSWLTSLADLSTIFPVCLRALFFVEPRGIGVVCGGWPERKYIQAASQNAGWGKQRFIKCWSFAYGPHRIYYSCIALGLVLTYSQVFSCSLIDISLVWWASYNFLLLHIKINAYL